MIWAGKIPHITGGLHQVMLDASQMYSPIIDMYRIAQSFDRGILTDWFYSEV